jgi:DNA-binding SARP family transcriptional activator
MARLLISLLGGFRVILDGEPVTRFESNKVRALLAYLAVESDRAHSREKLAALLWPEMPDREARNNLRSALSNLRQALGDLRTSQPFLSINWQAIQFDRDRDVVVDVSILDRCVSQSPLILSDLEKAINLYQGDFLEGFSLGGCTAFEEWTLLKRERFRQQALSAFCRLAQAYEEDGDITRALPFARRQVELEPWSEEAHRYLMRLLAFNGQRSAALAQFEVCQRALAEELDVTPSIETTHLYEQIRDGEIASLPQVQKTDIPPIEKPLSSEIEPSKVAHEVASPKRGSAFPHRYKMVASGLLVLCLLIAAIFLASKLVVPKPINVLANGKIIVPCSDQALQRLCVVDSQTGQLSVITDNLPVDRIGPGESWSPDGKQIVFSASTKPKQGLTEDFDLYLIDVDGANLRQITTGNTNDVMPAWSPDGTLIAFHRDCNLWVVHPNGSQAEPLSYGLCATGLAWSPDSQWIAFMDTNQVTERQRPVTIRVFRRGGGNSRIIYTFNQPVNGGRLAWSPDGQQIFCIDDLGNGKEETLLMDASGKGVLKAGLDIPENWFQDFWPQWSEK